MFVITNLFFRNICDHDVEYRNWLNKLLTRACFTVAQRINKNSIFTHCTMRLISNVPLSKLCKTKRLKKKLPIEIRY